MNTPGQQGGGLDVTTAMIRQHRVRSAAQRASAETGWRFEFHAPARVACWHQG